MADDTGWTFAQLPCSGTFNDAMPATVDIGEGTVRWRVYQDAAQFINNPKEGVTVQGGTPLSCLGSYEYVVIDITAQEQQPPQRANAFSMLRSPTAQTFHPLPSPSKGLTANCPHRTCGRDVARKWPRWAPSSASP